MTPEQAATITAGAQVVNTGINAMAQSNLNKKTQRWNEKMMAQQRQQSLADWTMQNEYNSPQAQMKRLKDAGLNPNLIYGKIDNSSSPVRSTDVKAWNPQAVRTQLDAAPVLDQYYDAQIKKQNIDNLKKQNDLITAQINHLTTSDAKLMIDTDFTRFKYGMGQKLEQTQLDMANANLRRITANIDYLGQQQEYTKARTAYTFTQNDIAKAANQRSMKLAAATLLQMAEQRAKTNVETEKIRQDIRRIQQDYRINSFEESIRKTGGSWKDPYYMRQLALYLEDIGGVYGGMLEIDKRANEGFQKGFWEKYNPFKTQSWQQYENRLFRPYSNNK